MSGIIGKNIGMTSLFDKTGKNIPCTVIEAGPCVVVGIKTVETDGYSAVQLGYDKKKAKNTRNALLGHFKKAGCCPTSTLTEFNGDFINAIKIGDKVRVSLFSQGELVDITGLSKSKGFQGVVKRHNFSGVGESTHGQHNRERAPGAIGAGSDPSRVFKGTKMAGRMGGGKVTVKNAEVLKVDLEKNLLVVKGSVPGSKKSYLIIKRWK